VTSQSHLRDGSIEARYLEVWVGRGRTISLHGNQPGGRKLVFTLYTQAVGH